MLEEFVKWLGTHMSLDIGGLLAIVVAGVVVWIRRRHIAASERRQDELREAKERERIEAMEAAMTIGKTARLLAPRLFFAPDGGLVPDLRETSHPFVFVRGKGPSDRGSYQSAYVDLWEEPQKFGRIQVEVAVPQVEEVEQDEAVQLPVAEGIQEPQVSRTGFVQILAFNRRIVTCHVGADGSAKITELKENQSKDDLILELPVGALPANRWQTVVIERTQDGCNICVGEGDRRTGKGTIRWPSAVHLRLGSHSRSVAPMAWFTKPRVS